MTQASTGASRISVAELAKRARTASRQLAKLSNDCRNEILMKAAKAIEESAGRILDSNERDCRAAERTVAAGEMSPSMFARLKVTPRGVEEMAARVRDVARLPDPLLHGGSALGSQCLDTKLGIVQQWESRGRFSRVAPYASPFL